MSNQCPVPGHDRLAYLSDCVAEDVRRYLDKSPMNRLAGKGLRKRVSAFFTPDVFSVFLYRFAHWFYVKGWRGPAALVTSLNFLVHKVSIAPQSCIGPGFRLPHPAGVVLCGTAGGGLTVYALAICCTSEGLADGPLEATPKLGERVTLGAGAVLLGSIKVGDDTKVSYNTRLDRDAPARSLVVSRKYRLLKANPLPRVCSLVS